MSTRAQQIADAPDHVSISKLCTPEEWRGYLWWMHDRRGVPPAGGEDGIEAAKIRIERDAAELAIARGSTRLDGAK